MIIKKINFIDPFTGKSAETEAHFHLNKNDLLKLEAKASSQGDADYEARIKRIIESNDNQLIFNEFKEIILMAYGKRQGSRFVKSDAISEEFSNSEEFSEFIWHLMQNEDELGEFFTNLITVATTTVERAPMLDEQRTKNVFDDQAPQDTGEVVHEMPPVAERGPVTNEVSPNPVSTQNDGRPRLLQGVELEKMPFTEVMKGVQEKRWRIE